MSLLEAKTIRPSISTPARRVSHNVAVGLPGSQSRSPSSAGYRPTCWASGWPGRWNAKRVNIELALRFDAPTTLGLVELGGEGVPQYAFYGNGAGRPASEEGRLPALPAEIGAIHLGSSPPWSNRSPGTRGAGAANAKGACGL